MDVKVVCNLHPMIDDTCGLGSAIKRVRKRGVETLDLGTDEAAAVGAGGGQLPHGLLALVLDILLVEGEDAPVDGEAGQVPALAAHVRHPVHGQDPALLVSHRAGIRSPAT